MLGTALSLFGVNIKRQITRQVRQLVLTTVFAVVGAILILLALGFGIAALFEWLRLSYGTLPALGILGGLWAVLGLIFLGLAFYRPRRASQPRRAVDLHEPAAAIADATEQAIDNTTGLVREGSRSQVFGAILIAALAGFLIGRRL